MLTKIVLFFKNGIFVLSENLQGKRIYDTLVSIKTSLDLHVYNFTSFYSHCISLLRYLYSYFAKRSNLPKIQRETLVFEKEKIHNIPTLENNDVAANVINETSVNSFLTQNASTIFVCVILGLGLGLVFLIYLSSINSPNTSSNIDTDLYNKIMKEASIKYNIPITNNNNTPPPITSLTIRVMKVINGTSTPPVVRHGPSPEFLEILKQRAAIVKADDEMRARAFQLAQGIYTAAVETKES